MFFVGSAPQQEGTLLQHGWSFKIYRIRKLSNFLHLPNTLLSGKTNIAGNKNIQFW